MRRAVNLLVLALVLAAAAGVAARAAMSAGVPLRARLDGGITTVPLGPGALLARADLTGVGAPGGPSVVQATWTVDPAVFEALRAGNVRRVTLNAGTLAATTAGGDQLFGAHSGTLVRTNNGQVIYNAQFQVTGGTGSFAGVSGGGVLHGSADVATLSFSLVVHGVLRK